MVVCHTGNDGEEESQPPNKHHHLTTKEFNMSNKRSTGTLVAGVKSDTKATFKPLTQEMSQTAPVVGKQLSAFLNIENRAQIISHDLGLVLNNIDSLLGRLRGYNTASVNPEGDRDSKSSFIGKVGDIQDDSNEKLHLIFNMLEELNQLTSN